MSIARGLHLCSIGMSLPLLLMLGCNNVPVHRVNQTFAIEVSEISENQEAIKLDFLWVIDTSSSMSEEQLVLANGFKGFVEVLQKYLKNIDIRVAVTTMDPFDAEAGNCSFNTKPADHFLPGSKESDVWPCLGNEDCVKQFGADWKCMHTVAASKLYTLNRSIRTSCEYRCKGDGDCCGEFCFSENVARTSPASSSLAMGRLRMTVPLNATGPAGAPSRRAASGLQTRQIVPVICRRC